MSKKTYRILAIVWTLIAVIGLLAYVGGIRRVNIGAFVFPLSLAITFWSRSRRKDERS